MFKDGPLSTKKRCSFVHLPRFHVTCGLRSHLKSNKMLKCVCEMCVKRVDNAFHPVMYLLFIIHPLDLWLEVDAETLLFFNMRALKIRINTNINAR